VSAGQDGSNLFTRVVYQEDHITRDQPVVEGWKCGLQSDWIWQDSLPVNQTRLWATLGSSLWYGWSGILSVSYLHGDSQLPVALQARINTARALDEKYYLHLRAAEVANLTLKFSHNFIRDDLRTEVSILHARFRQPFWRGLEDFSDTGLTAADISLSYLTILGRISVGWSFSDLEDYQGISWTRLGLTL
jgi:hypothetical protein